MKRVCLQASNSSTDGVLVGRIGRPHGLHGYVIVHPDTDNPDRFRPGSSMADDSGRSFVVERSQTRGDTLLVRFAGVDDRTAAEGLTGTLLYIDPGDRRPLDEDEYWPDDLVGLTVVDHDGRVVGSVIGMIEGAAQFRLDIQASAGRFEVPFVVELVPDVDLESGTIRLADMPGLIPED